jgi:predicted NBD/HSP70 family sugar kinase
MNEHREDRMTYYVALDVGLRMVSLCIVDEAGGVKLEKSLPSEIEDIVACLRDFGEEVACVGLDAAR